MRDVKHPAWHRLRHRVTMPLGLLLFKLSLSPQVIGKHRNGIGDEDEHMKTPEQEARDLLEQYGLDGAQMMTSGDVVELANFINHAWAWRKEHGRCPHGMRPDDGCSRCADPTLSPQVIGKEKRREQIR